jgi:hypothetical protein
MLRTQLSELPDATLWVVADNCRDATALETEAAGAHVAVRTKGALGKGAAIACCRSCKNVFFWTCADQ